MEPPDIELDPALEERCAKQLEDLLTARGWSEPQRNVEIHFSFGGPHARLQFLDARAPQTARQRLLVSGAGMGSEMIAARAWGFDEISGTEVDGKFVDLIRVRLADRQGFDIVQTTGVRLPFPDEHFSCVLSSHVIEHTGAPAAYLGEHLRVLRAGGILFLEFPNRYHRIELHTRLPSYEWLPAPWRWLALRFLQTRFSRLPWPQRNEYRIVRQTLTPISMWQLRRWLARLGSAGGVVIHNEEPAPGFVRCLIRKN
jgi:SAM-dependent methyltransferase